VTDGICPAIVNWMEPEAIDNCGVDTLYSTHEPGDAFNAGQTTVTYTAVDFSGNMRTYSFNVIINAQPIALAGDDQLVCGNTATLTATPAPFGTGQWSVLSGAGTFADSSDPATSVSDLAAGVNVFQWKVTNGTCGADSTSVEIVRNANGIIFVNQNATGDDNGTDWANAFRSLQAALDFAANCSPATIWIAQGTYLPTVGSDRNISFNIPAETTLLGGFNGSESLESERRPDTYRTILSGNINASGAFDNTYHIVKVEADGVVLDGLHITESRAEGGIDSSIGGGLFFVPSGDATLSIRNTNFYNNTAQNGGAIGFIANGMTAVLDLTNISFANNHAALQGGAIAASQNSGGTATLHLVHASFGGNTATGSIGNNGSALYLDGAAANVSNSILWDDGNEILSEGASIVTLDNVIVRGGTMAQDVNPRYDDVVAGNLRLSACSPAIDAGDAAGIPATDIALNTRIFSAEPDLGAYEYDGTNYAPPILSASDAALSATMEFTDADGWTHYYYCSNDGNGDRLVMSIKKEGQDLGELGDDLMVRNVTTMAYGTNNAFDLSTADYVETPSWYVIGRYWDVDTPMPVSDSVRVRYYYSGKDTADLKTAMEAVDGLWTGDTSLYFFKVSGAGIDPFDEVVIGNGGAYTEYRHAAAPSLSTWTKGVFNGLMYAEYFVSSFSGGGGGGSPGPTGPSGALPLELIAFKAQRVNDQTVQLHWQTALELNIDTYEIERSADDGRSWQKVGAVASLGDSEEGHSYHFMDANALQQVSYYRLRIIELDDLVSYSNIVAVVGVAGKTKLALAPNPTSGSFQITLEGSDLQGQSLDLQISNSLGQVLYLQTFEPDAVRWTQDISELSDLPAGVYPIAIKRDGQLWQMARLVKE